MKWEYLVIGLIGATDERGFAISFEDKLNEMGSSGWELTAVDDSVAYLKRPIEITVAPHPTKPDKMTVVSEQRWNIE